MRLFTCQNCKQTLYFENTRCTFCGSELGYLPDSNLLTALQDDGSGGYTPAGDKPAGKSYRKCGNYAGHAVCNWMVPADDEHPLCVACRLNTTIPDLSVSGNARLWQRLEIAKHRLIYSLLRFNLPLVDRHQDSQQGLAFEFLAEPEGQPQLETIPTGHASGLITINIAEANDAARENMREHLSERYRTLLGHFRHEIGHYYWDRLVRDSDRLAAFRELFGDETLDYDQALQRHYSQGPPANWQSHFISAYASAHPWEDWAESWAHYLHMVDTLDTASEFGIRISLPDKGPSPLPRHGEFDAYRSDAFDTLLQLWLPVTLALNSLTRSMGQPDPYPFVLSAPSAEKLAFVHGLIRDSARPPD